MSLTFRHAVSTALIAALIAASVPLPAVAGTTTVANHSATGTISGSARADTGRAMPNSVVRLRNVMTGQMAGVMRAGASGEFSFAALGPGLYTVEVMTATGEVGGTSAVISLTPSAMVATGRVVSARSLAAQAQTGAGGGSFFTSAWGIVTLAAIGAGVVGITYAVTKDDASPSQ